MRHGDPGDPLLRQVLPVLDEEQRIVPGFGLDAVGDAAARRGGGVIHKYHGRALLVATGSCAVHCRYCFRRHYPVCRGHRRRRGLARRGRADPRRRLDPRSDPVRRRSAVAGRPTSWPNSPMCCAASPISVACASTPACRWSCRNGWTPACWPGCAACRGRSPSSSMPTMPTSSMPRSMRRWPACAPPGRPCSTRPCCCVASTIPSTPWPTCASAAMSPAYCPTTCTSSTAWPARRTSKSTMPRPWPCMPRWPRACPATWCRDWCAKSPAAPGKTPLANR